MKNTGKIRGRVAGKIADMALPLLPLIGLAAIALQAQPAEAQAEVRAGAAETLAPPRPGAVLEVPVNKSQVLRLDRVYAKAMIGNPDVADVMPMSTSSIYVLGKKMGSTSLSIHDRQGRMISVVDVVVGPDTLSLKRQLGQMFPGEPIGVRVANGSLVLEGEVSNAVVAERAVALANSYAPDAVINMLTIGSPQQVLLEVRFSEVQRNALKDIGFQHGFTGDVQGGLGRGSAGTSRLISDNGFPVVNNSAVPPETFARALTSYSFLGLNVVSALDALEQKGLSRTLAQPNLIALSGQNANFLAGGEFPVPVASNPGSATTAAVVTIAFKEFGIKLDFTPTVLADGLINLAVKPEVSSIDPTVSVTLNGFVIPGLKTRRATTTLEMRDGQTFAMAGLISNDFTNTVRQVPLLGQVPILGALFRSTQFNRNETELVITVTPRLVRPTKDRPRLPTDTVLEPKEADMFLLGRTEGRAPAAGRGGQPAAKAPAGVGIPGEHGHVLR